MTLWLEKFPSPLGEIAAIGDKSSLYFIEFTDHPNLEEKYRTLEEKSGKSILLGKSSSLELLQHELSLYFSQKLQTFTVPLVFFGTPFQKTVWQELQKIPYGETRSYSELALAVGVPRGHRAVAMTNSKNRLPIVVPCHRVIQADGSIGGFSSGLPRKYWMLNHEKAGTVT